MENLYKAMNILLLNYTVEADSGSMIELFVNGVSTYFVCQLLHVNWRLFDKYILELRVLFSTK